MASATRASPHVRQVDCGVTLKEGPVVTDYVLVPDAYAQIDNRSTRPVVEFDSPRHIHGDIWIAQVDHALCEAVLDACEPRGENFKPTRQWGCMYAFYRRNAPSGSNQQFHFDSDGAL